MAIQPPQDLVDYLLTLISPPEEKALYLSSLEEMDWSSVALWGDNTVAGILVKGQPSDDQAKELLRVLKPGAHLLLIAPDAEPTGHTGACTIEDAGFEIRDAILWAREPDSFHYVPKADRGEREAGCFTLEGKTGAEAVGRKEGAAGTANGRAGAGHSSGRIKNFHPTVKPVELMERLLRDVPKEEGPVLDPFMGSGSTGVACLETGHDFIGIEREPDYAKIATARARYWDRAAFRARDIVIESDVEEPQAEEMEPEPVDPADFMFSE
jgi:DNA modification methylase